MMNYWGIHGWDVMNHFGFILPLFLPLIIALAIWSLVWKGLALWKAARVGSRNWFVALLILNTLGILEILYIYVFSKKATPPAHDHHGHEHGPGHEHHH